MNMKCKQCGQPIVATYMVKLKDYCSYPCWTHALNTELSKTKDDQQMLIGFVKYVINSRSFEQTKSTGKAILETLNKDE